MESRKQDIIIQVGGEWIRVGLVSDRAPRKTIPSQDMASFRSDLPQYEYQIKIEELLYTIFYTHINSSCLNKTVILLQKVYTDRRIVQAIAKVLFKKFKIQKLEYSLSCITPLYLTGRYSGIVVSGGSSCIQIMPVFQNAYDIVGFPLIQNFKYIPSGTHAMTKVIKDQLLLMNPEAGPDVFQKITNQYLNDLKNLYSNMNLVESKSQQAITLNFKKSKLKLKPASISYSNIFGNPEAQEYNMAYMFLEALNKIDNKMLPDIVSNIVFAGGIWRIKGMQMYFKKKIKQYLPKFKKLQKFQLAEKIKFVAWSFNPSQVSWIGCSVGASVRGVESLCLKRSEYENEGFQQKIMSNYFLSN